MAINMESGFEIFRFSDSNYDEITVEIQFNGEQIAQLNKDKGLQFIEIEFFSDFIEPNFIPKFLMKDFLMVLNEAQRLLENS
ncbi:hypothetical protein KR51_00037240 [Rubidibacter lacunae KORDI 51-2]|uniref:Uncharacterized protein n=1 Tax=Rubidibacter lacunae KORDI 51-2 TaxID=582515 RepID=U5DET6_9CHRO|nr:hypothetical protein [Rubidibacter lacunae]ERN39812.1 hypothetical protein KR51_00037240 [Rubidibacter lacunae KORDI 51-2]